MSPRSMLAAALRYAALGWPVFPIYEPVGSGCSCAKSTECPRPGKHPRNRHGHRAASNDPDRIEHWWGVWPHASIALRCDDGLVVDVDGPEGARSLESLERQYGLLPCTVAAATGNGRHLFFAIPHALKTTSHHLGAKIDTRATGGYVILPPSRHASGRRYRWVRSPLNCELALAPMWIVERLSAHPFGAVPGLASARRQGTAPNGGARDPSRSGADMALALRLLREGADDDRIERELYRTSQKIAEEKTHNSGTYVALTIANARAIHDASTPRARVREARLEHLPARFGKPELTRVHLDLVTGDGEIITASIVVPSAAYPQAKETWKAALPDVAPAGLTALSWGTVTRAWEAITWRGRVFEVAVRGGEVRWIRAAMPLRETGRARKPRAAGGAR